MPENTATDMWSAFSDACHRHAARPAYRLYASDAHEATYNDVLIRVRRLCARLKQARELHDAPTASNGQVVHAALLPNCWQHMELFYAAAGLRTMLSPLNHRLAAAELQEIIGESSCAVLFAATSLAALIDKIDFEQTKVKLVVWIDIEAPDAAAARRSEDDIVVQGMSCRSFTSMTWPGGPNSADDEFEPPEKAASSPQDGLQLFFTSGTTGKPKGVVHSHSMVYNHSEMTIKALRLMDSTDDAASGETGKQQHCWGHFGPMFHVGDVAFIWITAMIGGRHAFHPQQRHVDEVLAVMYNEGVTITKLVPTMLANIVTGSYISDAAGGNGKGFSALRWVLTGGAPLSPELRHEVGSRLGCHVVQGYGMTEATCHVSFSWDPSSTGMEVIPGLETRILGEDDRALPEDGSIGEVVVRGPNIHSGYLGPQGVRPKDAESGFLEDGFFRTGDLGYKNDRGLLFISGRKKDVIIVGGENVFASEVERVIDSHPAVLKSGVVGKADPTFGELVIAAVTLADQQHQKPLNPRQLMSYCRKRLASYKCPVQIYVLPEMPMTPSLKVIKPKLKAVIAARDAELAEANMIARTPVDAALALHQVGSRSSAAAVRTVSFKDTQLSGNLLSMVPSYSRPGRPASSAEIAHQQRQSRLPSNKSTISTIQDMIEDLIGERLDPAADLLEAGLDSVLSLQLVGDLDQAFNAELPGGLLFEHPSIDAIVEYLQSTGSLLDAAAATPAYTTSPSAAALPSNRQSDVFDVLEEVVEDLTGERIAKDADLLLEGLDSVLALQLVSSLEEAFGIELPGGLLYEYPTMQAIAGFILGITDSSNGGVVLPLLNTEATGAIKSRQSSLVAPDSVQITVVTSDADEQQTSGRFSMPSEPPPKPISQLNPLVLLANVLGLLVRPCLLALGFIPFILACHYIHVTTNLYVVFASMPFVMTACVALMMHLVLLVKWVLLGRVKPGRHKLYSWFYLRWLVVHNLFRTFAVWYGPFRETFVVRWFFRLGGARIGKGVSINTMWITDPDLVSIGDWSTLARDVNVQPSYITNGWLVLQPVTVGHSCALRHGSSVICGGSVPSLAALEPLVCASGEEQIMPGVHAPPEVNANRHSRRGILSTMAVLLYIGYGTSAALCCGAAIVIAAFLASGVPVPTKMTTIFGQPEYLEAVFYYLLALPPAIYIIMPWAYFAFAALTKLVIVGEFMDLEKVRDAEPAGRTVRRFLLARTQDNILFHICLRQSVMSHTTNLQYKAMGAHIGRRSVLCMPYMVEYDLLHAEDDSMLMGETAVLGYDGAIQERVVVRTRGALANSVVLRPGCEVGEGALLGDFTVGPQQKSLSANLIWSGKPKPYAVSRTAGNWDEPKNYTVSQVFLCTLQLILGPVTIYPGYIAVRYLQVAITTALMAAGVEDMTRQLLILTTTPLYILTIFLCKALVALLIKWVLAGNYRRTKEKNSKTSYQWVAWIALEALILDVEDVVLLDLRGTAFLVWWYRALGAKIGKNCTIFAAPLGAEFDLKTIGDNVCFNFNCRLFGHSIEGHALNFGPCDVGSDVTVGVRSILELGASVPSGTVISHHTAVHAKKSQAPAAPAAGAPRRHQAINGAAKTTRTMPVKTKPSEDPSVILEIPPSAAEVHLVKPAVAPRLPPSTQNHASTVNTAAVVASQTTSISSSSSSRPPKLPLHHLQAEFFSIADLEAGAKERLEPRYWDYYSGAAEGEETLRDNSAAFRRISIMPRVLVDVSVVDMRRKFLGRTLQSPVIVAPSAMHRLADREGGENATSRAAAKAGAAMVLSTASTTPLEEVAAMQQGSSTSFLMFQLYCMRDRQISLHLIRRAEAAGYKALVVTVDAPRLGRRHRDMRNHMAGHKFPAEVKLSNLELLSHGKCMTTACRLHAMDDQHDDGLTWEGIKWIQSVTTLPVLVKGVLRADDAVKAVENGCSGIVISNHGGRQLNFSPATITVTKEICDAVGGRIPVLMDGGIRSGTDIFKALALGATAVLVGRPALFGLAVGGSDGVFHALDLLKTELELTMALSGCTTLDDINLDMIRTESPF